MHALNPPPTAIRWLVTTVFWLGSIGVIVVLVILGLLVPRLAAVRWTAVAAVITWGVCLLLGEILGPSAGRPALSVACFARPATRPCKRRSPGTPGASCRRPAVEQGITLQSHFRFRG